MSLTTSEMTPADIAAVTGGGYNNGGYGFGGDGWWVILFLILAMGGNWGNGFGGNGGNGGGWNGSIPWILNNDNDIERGFDQQATMGALSGIQSSISNGFANASTQLCNCCSDMQMALANGFAGVEAGANARQMANMQQNFALQSQFADCCCENRLGLANLANVVQTENCADRYEAAQNTRDIIESQTRGTQAILDKLCALELDTVKQDNANLRTQLNMASLAASQAEQTAGIRKEIIDELRSCPIPSMPVYGQTPIFTCNNNGCGCGCGGNF